MWKWIAGGVLVVVVVLAGTCYYGYQKLTEGGGSTVVMIGAFLSVRYYGVQAGWWSSLLPFSGADSTVDSAVTTTQSIVSRVISLLGD